MDSGWQTYPDSAGASQRHNGNSHIARDYTGQASSVPSQQQLPSSIPGPALGPLPTQNTGYGYDQYHGGGGAPVHRGANPVSSPIAGPQVHDNNGDVAMHDAHDAHAGIKYPMRPHHQSHLSGGRPVSLHSSQEQPSAAAQRYSPMDTLSPASPYAGGKTSQFGNPPSLTQSPTTQTDYSQSPYYPSRQQGHQLPPMSPYGSGHDGFPSSVVAALDGSFNDPKSPRRSQPPLLKPVPEFRKVRAVTDLQPKNSRQPRFRRANPEGGFISVSDSANIASPCCL